MYSVGEAPGTSLGTPDLTELISICNLHHFYSSVLVICNDYKEQWVVISGAFEKLFPTENLYKK